MTRVVRGAEGLAKIPAKQRAIWLKGRSRLQISSTFGEVAFANPAQAASQPAIAKRAIRFNGLLKRTQRGRNLILRAQDKSAQSQRLRVFRAQFQRSFKRLCGLPMMSKRKLQFRHSRPCKTERWRFFRRAPRGF